MKYNVLQTSSWKKIYAKHIINTLSFFCYYVHLVLNALVLLQITFNFFINEHYKCFICSIFSTCLILSFLGMYTTKKSPAHSTKSLLIATSFHMGVSTSTSSRLNQVHQSLVYSSCMDMSTLRSGYLLGTLSTLPSLRTEWKTSPSSKICSLHLKLPSTRCCIINSFILTNHFILAFSNTSSNSTALSTSSLP